MPKVSSYHSAPHSIKTNVKQVPRHERQYLCPVDGCVFVCAVSSILLRHKRKVHISPIACDLCEYTTPEQYNLKRHKKTRHSTINPKNDLTLPYDPFNLCNFKDDFILSYDPKDDFALPCNLCNFKDDLALPYDPKDDFALPYNMCNFKDDFALPCDFCDSKNNDYWWLDYLLN